MSDARVIKRYANRKLYDTQHSRYVTLEQISEMIRDGDDVKIIDNKTKEDLTSVTLAQIIFEEEKKQRSFLSLQTMRQLIQNGGESFTSLITEAQRRVTSMLPRRKEDGAHEGGEAASAEAGGPDSANTNADADTDADEAPEGSQVPQETTAMGKRGRDALAALHEFREWIQQTQHTIDEWQKRVDHRIRDMVEGISPFSGIQKDVTGLAVRIAELEAKLAHLTTDVETAAAPAEPAAAPAPAPTKKTQHATAQSDAAHTGDNPGASDA